MDYLSFFPSEGVALLVEAGEGGKVEFKSTFRWDLRQDKKNAAITHASLKTIAAFLNTDGGTLLIGVADDNSASAKLLARRARIRARYMLARQERRWR